MDKKFEVHCDETINALRKFQEISLNTFGAKNVDLSNISQAECINLYATLEKTKENILKLRELMS